MNSIILHQMSFIIRQHTFYFIIFIAVLKNTKFFKAFSEIINYCIIFSTTYGIHDTAENFSPAKTKHVNQI